MKADPTAQLKLIDVQALDSKAAQLRHQQSTLPEIAEIAALTGGRKALEDQVRDARIVVDDLTAVQVKAEKDVEAVRARRDRDQARLSSVPPKEVARITDELAAVTKRIAELEDDELEVMARLEDAQRDLAELEERLAATDERVAALQVARDEKSAAIGAELSSVLAGRPELVEGMPADLLALYDRLREKSGTGAAELRARQCGGCMLTLDSKELSRIRSLPSDEVVRCEECSRILVKTSESGL